MTEGSLRPASIPAELATDLVAACRLLHAQGLLTYSGHVSARLPDGAGMVIHSRDKHRGAVTAADLLTCDLTGQAHLPAGQQRVPIEVFIHTGIYRNRPDVQSVVHTHSPLAAVFSTTRTPIVAAKNHAYRWRDGVPTHPDPTHIGSSEQGAELAATLGRHHAALLRTHGGVIVAESIEAAVVDSIHFEENLKTQLAATSLGQFAPLTDDELDRLSAGFNRERHVRRLWRYYLEDATLGRNHRTASLEPEPIA
ncbi:class II aldolase/adducin family protein [Kribbella solani]|uniref:Ribulose-5-phosphate 4-epimerase/fuculose-1-phosphate aldolase n=1 Tax=Kribbella solani TaxID=236067 RepID=A0A841DLQ8_9ACTN|nr:class II aldolase/adducin family protein [Kribbella solani]MBB5980034.1 ribulose-5-phosphate 4-epimerase/fuculose-1-phosphate aldolase [Kribbella solani]